MKYYSELLNKVYDTAEELYSAEYEQTQKENAEKERQKKLKDEKDKRYKELKEAEKHYLDLFESYVKDYGHSSFYNTLNNLFDFFSYR